MIWVIGSANMDINYRLPHLPQKGETVLGSALARMPGGKGANAACAAARFFPQVRLVGRMGDDAYATDMLDSLKAHGVDCAYVTNDGALPSGHAVIYVDEEGANQIMVCPGANGTVEFDEKVPIGRQDYVLAQFEIPLKTVADYFICAKKRGATTVLNPSPVMEVPTDILAHTDILVVNEVEVGAITGAPRAQSPEDAVKAAGKLLGPRLQNIVVTLGAQGVVTAARDRSYHIPAFPVQVVDTQGAGDAFLGSFVAHLASGHDILDSAAFGNLVASLSTAKAGSTQASLPGDEELAAAKVGLALNPATPIRCDKEG